MKLMIVGSRSIMDFFMNWWIEVVEANDSSSVSLAYSASLRGKFALQTLRLPPSPTGEGLVRAKLLDRSL